MTEYLKESGKGKKTMSSYYALAQFYDSLTENVDYKVRSDYISNFFSKYYDSPRSVLDLACGTGNIAVNLVNEGYKVTGIDLSEEMLCEADNKADGKMELLKADMTDFKLDSKFDCCVCSLDSINHLLSLEDVEKCFNCVYGSLKSDGIFVFDVNTVYKHNNILAGNTFVFDEEDFFLSWDNEDEGENIIRILIDIFVFNGKSYDRLSEEFFERAYTVSELESVLYNFEIIGIYDDLSLNEYTEQSERIYFVCKRK